MKTYACYLVMFLAAALPLHSGAQEWRMDPGASRLEFIASFEKAPAPGVFKEFDIRMRFDPARPAEGRLEVNIRVPSADMASADINKAIASAEWFDFLRFPQAQFTAGDIRRSEGNRFLARGTLSLKGTQQQVEVPFSWSGTADGASMEGELTLRRSAFAIGTGEWAATNVIGADVKVRFRVRLRKAG